MTSSVQLRLQFIVLLWGFTGILGKSISMSTIPLTWSRMLIAVITIFIILKVTKVPLQVTRKNLFTFLGIGGVIGLHWLAFFGAIKASNVAIALSTLSTGALFSALLEPLFFKRKINALEIVLAIIVSTCIILIYNAEPEYWLGIVLGIICSFLSALFSIFNAKVYHITNTKKIMFYEMIGGWAVVSIFFIFTGGCIEITNIPNKDIIFLLALGSLFTAYPMIESVSLMKYISPFTLLLNVNLEPVYGIILAYFIFGESEKMTPLFYIATIIMILAIVLNIWMKKRDKLKSQHT